MCLRYLKNLPVQLCLCLCAGLLLGDYLSLSVVRGFYTASCFLKDFLMIFLPFIIFAYISAALLSFEQKAPLLLLAVLVLVILSNALTVTTGYAVMKALLPWIHPEKIELSSLLNSSVTPFFTLNIPSPLSSDRAMMLGVVVGLGLSFTPSLRLKAQRFALRARNWATFFLKKAFIPFLPIYVLGFILKLDHDDSFNVLIRQYSHVFFISTALIFIYIFLLYGLASRFEKSQWARYMREMIPAGITGFSTMSSAATMPLTLEATEKNTDNPSYTQFVIPTTVNIHLLADGLNISLTGLFLGLMIGNSFPSFLEYLPFVIYYCLAKFSCAAVPGGGVLVLIPVVQTYLHLPTEVAALLATLYILQDPIMTAGNVMGNGVFPLITQRWLRKLGLLRT